MFFYLYYDRNVSFLKTYRANSPLRQRRKREFLIDKNSVQAHYSFAQVGNFSKGVVDFDKTFEIARAHNVPKNISDAGHIFSELLNRK